MTLDDLIAALKDLPPEMVVRHGFDNPHSYRGYYDQLAFEPAENVSVAEMLADAMRALGSTYEGYKGGEYEMGGYTDVWLAQYGCCGEAITSALIETWRLGARLETAEGLLREAKERIGYCTWGGNRTAANCIEAGRKKPCHYCRLAAFLGERR